MTPFSHLRNARNFSHAVSPSTTHTLIDSCSIFATSVALSAITEKTCLANIVKDLVMNDVTRSCNHLILNCLAEVQSIS